MNSIDQSFNEVKRTRGLYTVNVCFCQHISLSPRVGYEAKRLVNRIHSTPTKHEFDTFDTDMETVLRVLADGYGSRLIMVGCIYE